MITVYNTETGKTNWFTQKEFDEYFGKDEGKEILAGYAPHLVATKQW